MLKPFSFNDYIELQRNAYCVLSDSGTLAEESGILHFPAVSLRTSTERPEAIDKGGFVLGGIERTSLLQTIDLVLTLNGKTEHTIPPDYTETNVSVKIVKIIQGYTNVVNRMIWRK
jgi:UDP-N-acetylglucosamine 2-epimerase (non-hydrolysing)